MSDNSCNEFDLVVDGLDSRVELRDANERERTGKVVRTAWMDWARHQPDCKDSWLTEWDDLEERHREVDRRIADAVLYYAADTIRAEAKREERERIAKMVRRQQRSVIAAHGVGSMSDELDLLARELEASDG